MKVRNLKALAIVGFGCLVSMGSLSAATIVGTADIGGALGSGGATVTATMLSFGTGAFTEQSPGTGSFAGVTGGTLKNLTLGTNNVLAFATFNGGVVSPIIFDLTAVPGGSGTAAQCSIATPSATSCTPPGSPFTLQQLTADTVSVSINFVGVSHDSTGTPLSPTTALFTTNLVAQGTIPSILASLGSGGSITASYSGRFAATAPTTGVPEPNAASLLVAGLGLLAGSRVVRKYRR